MADCSQVAELYESYALGVLDPADRALIEEHLARGCPTCTAGAERARQLVANLAYLAPDAEPPAALRRKLLNAVRAQEPRSEPRRSWIPIWALAAAAALVLFAVYTTMRIRQFESEVAALDRRAAQEEQRNQALDSERARYQQALEIIAASATKQMQLTSAKTAMPAVTAYWNPMMGLVLAADKMPDMPSGRTLQLWVVPRKGEPVSIGIFRPNASGQILMVMPPEDSMTEAKALAISDEPAGGSPQPTSTPEWVGPMG